MGTALVTGATSGIGEEFCWQLASAGHDLVLVARREDALRALADSLANVAGVRAEVIAADLSTDSGCLNVGSVASRTGAGTYSAHKAWVVAFTEGLAAELAGSGITATVVCPGPVDTPFFDRVGVDMSGMPSWLMASPERVVTDALDAVRAGRIHVTPTATYKVAMGIMKIAPRWVTARAMRAVPHM